MIYIYIHIYIFTFIISYPTDLCALERDTACTPVPAIYLAQVWSKVDISFFCNLIWQVVIPNVIHISIYAIKISTFTPTIYHTFRIGCWYCEKTHPQLIKKQRNADPSWTLIPVTRYVCRDGYWWRGAWLALCHLHPSWWINSSWYNDIIWRHMYGSISFPPLTYR